MTNNIRNDVLDELGISADLDQEFRRQASYYASWAFKSARAQSLVRQLEEKSDLLFSQLYRKYRQEHADAKENDCKAYIRRQSVYRVLLKQFRRAQYEADVLKVAVRSFEQRRDMLMQLGAQYRSEQNQSGMQLRAKTEKASRIVRKTFNK